MWWAEISEIAWHKLKDIPTDKDKEDASKEKAKYWMVIPFVVTGTYIHTHLVYMHAYIHAFMHAYWMVIPDLTGPHLT